MKRMMMLLAAAALLGACDLSDAIANPGFDEWCGDVPCGWEKDGEIKRVSTWHSHDYAVSFESDDARLHQLATDEVYGCIEFSMLAKVSAPKLAYIELDFLDDGVSDWTKEIPPSDFEPLTFYVRAPEWYSGVRFIVRKEGPGEMVLAQLGARYADETRCAGSERVVLTNLQGGTACDDDEQCASGECRIGYCVGCDNDDDCEDGLVCGYRNVTSRGGVVANAVPVCIQPATREIGTICLGDAECASGVCCEGVCSECCGDGGECGEGVACAPSVATDAESFALLHQCAPGEMLGEPGDVCSDDSDCASGACGELQCTGLCSFIGLAYGGAKCAQLECEASSCGSLTCAVETVDVGRCD